MPELLTMQDLANGHLDVKALGEAANGDENTIVTTRTGNTYPSAERAINTMFQNGGLPAKAFATKANMEIDGAALADGQLAQVYNETANNGLYVKTAGAWVKSKHDPLGQSLLAVSELQSDTESKIIKDGSPILVQVKDLDGLSIVTIDSNGGLHLPELEKTVQDELNTIGESISPSKGSAILELKDSGGGNVAVVDEKGALHLTGLKNSVQDALGSIEDDRAATVGISGTQAVGKALYAELPDGFKAKSYQWFLDGSPIEGEVGQVYTVKSSDLFKSISVTAKGISGGKNIVTSDIEHIGGVEIGEAGKSGSVYEGFVLSAGDDFNELDIIAPHKPLGRWFTTKPYLPAPRGSSSLLKTLYDADPYHTGHNDSNRGVPVGFDNMYVKDSVLSITGRTATKDERKHFQGTTRKQVAGMVASIGAFSMYAGDAGTGDNILEFRVRHTHKDINPKGWHPSLWTQSSLPSQTYGSNEWDISEGSHRKAQTNYNEWGLDGRKVTGSAHTSFEIMDGEWHTITAKFSHTKFELYIDGKFIHDVVKDTNSFNEPAYALITNHIYSGTYDWVAYDESDWERLTKGATIDVDFVRLWRRNGRDHIKPVGTVAPVNIEYGTVGVIQLPSMTELWGREDINEHVQTVMTEENEPRGHHTVAYDTLPSFVTYNEESRLITIDTAGQKSGRLNFVIYGYKQDGSTSEPIRTYANISPNINIPSINLAQNGTFDLYVTCDCGVLVTDGVKRTKTISVNGLPVGAVYNDETGLIYANYAEIGSHSIGITCVNSVGQSTTKTINLIIT